jgi:hypothetical protein
MADRVLIDRDTFSIVQSRRIFTCAVLLLLIAFSPASVQAADESQVTLQEKIWGFDGRVQTGQFNPVSFLIDNRTEDSIDAVAALSRLEGIVGTTGGRFQQSVFIGPGAQRWVQLYPYIGSDDQSNWIFTLGDQEFRGQTQPRSTTALDSPKSKKKPRSAAIILDAPGTMSLKPTTVKHFPETIFPPWATATVGLHTIFMDHAPDWETPRQEALMSWLRRGGQLHLLKNARDAWPTFGGVMSDLSQPLSTFSVGNGFVVRHEFQRNELTESVVRIALDMKDDNNPDELPDEQLTVNSNSGATPSLYHTTDVSWLDDSWFQAMRQFTQPAHAWWLIFLLALVYIGAIFPGCWLLAQQKRHFLTVYGAIVGLSIVFSLLFLLIGRRGYGEFTTQHTLAISRLDNSTTQNVIEWNALFVTNGDQYTVSGSDQQALFAIPGLRQQTNATMTSGNDGQLSVGIPPFSTQTFICRRQLPIADWQLSALSSRLTTNGIADLQIQCGPAFPTDEQAQIRLQYRKQLYRVRFDEETGLLEQQGRIGPLAKVCSEYYQNNYANLGWGFYSDDSTEDFYEQLLPAMILRSLADDGIYDPRESDLPADRVRLFVSIPIPADHFIETNTTPQQNGRILYVCDIPLRPNK